MVVVDNNNKRRFFIDDVIRSINLPRLFISNKCLFYSNSFVNIEDLSKVLGKTAASLVSFFWNRGQKVTRNQNLSEEVLTKYCLSLGLSTSRIKTDFNLVIDKYLNTVDLKLFDWRERTIVVSVMGHIDHGKTTLVDNICHTNIQKKETGGISQKISNSLIEFQKRKILFLDTPGHNDFIRLRKKGISLTDVVILVIDGSEGVMLQTEEIIGYLHQYSLPVIVFINQKDEKKQKDSSEILGQLQERELVPLEWEGNTIVLFGSAKDLAITSTMLENVLLLVDCRANFSGPTFGVIMDSYLHPRFNSIINKVFLQGGILKEGDFLFSGGKVGQIKTVSGEKKERLKTAVPGEVVLITGFGHTMELGERFIVINQNEFQELFREIELRKTRFRNSVIPDFFSTEKKTINLFLLADTENSLQTMIDLVQKKEYIDVFFNVVGLAVSQLFQSDLELALITKSVLLSFNVDVGSFVTTYVKENKLVLFGSHIIYEISKFLDAVVEEQKNKEKVISEVKKGEAKIKVVYSFSKGNIAGCWVNDGVIDRSGKVYLIRDNKKIYTGKIKSLEIERTSVKEAKAGQECGIVLNKFDDYRVGDIIVVYQLVESTKVT